MKPKFYLLAILLLSLASHQSAAQILRAFAPRYNNPSVRGNIVYVANSIVSTSGIGSGVPGTAEVPPTGSSVNNNGNAINIDIDNTTTTIIPYLTSWKYLDNNTRPASWETSGFADGLWTSGTLVTASKDFGYGDGDEDICVKYGGGYGSCPASPVCNPTPAACSTKYVTTLFRKQFTVTGLVNYSSFTLNVHRDDGIVIYINGTEVTRSNMPAGAVTNATLASAAVDGATEDVTINIGTTAFIEGTNTIAVEIHQTTVSSNDISFRMEMIGNSDQGTFNSSSADLNLPACSQVLFAGLYWGSGEGSSTGSTAWITGETACKIKFPGSGTYTTLTSTQTDYHNPTLIPGYAHTGFKCFKDITSLINTTNANGTYTVANVLSPTIGVKDCYGGWTLVIAYANATLPPRNLSVFDGNAIVKSGSGNVDVGISGFLTPPSGTVSCELGAVVYDGDRTSSDAYSFKQNGAGSFYDLTPTANNPTSNSNDMFNSVIAYKGVVVTTRNPAFKNTLGYDANIINLPNTSNAQLSNSQTSATVRFSSPSENYIVQVLTTAISQYNPAYAFDKTSTDVNGGTLVPGDTLRYVINYSNVGNDASTSSMILDRIPSGTSFLPGSIKINSVTKTDGSGDDQAEYDLVNNQVVFRIGTGATSAVGGTITNGTSGAVQFDVIVASSCNVLSCVGAITNSARINYKGQTSGSVLYDSSGVSSSGCITQGPNVVTVSGTCSNPLDTILTNKCPVTNVSLPWKRYAGYTIYSAMPFVAGNIYNPLTPVTVTHIYWAYFDNGVGCSDTVKISVFIISCPDIDDDNDGIPDYVELNNPVALQDANGNGVLNWNDNTYPGYIDNNLDGFNDMFDPSGDSDNDNTPNFYDPDFPGYVDSNGDGVNDNMDKDLDGIPNHLDLDSDNDGIPDTVESFGVDANGDGLIDNYSDSDADGLSQNVDGSNLGVNNSGVALGAIDTDGDGIPNYLDKDSDNDGIPDVIEAYGTDSNNDGKVDGFTDLDGDGFSDNVDGDVGNDGTAENTAAALLKTSSDANGDGRADSYPNKNMDSDAKPNPYDLDSDNDGITDVKEAQFTDANYDGLVDGSVNADGWNTGIAALGTLTIPNTDGSGRSNPYDIDSDNDGIPDNVEGMSTTGYILPSATDTDGDGIRNSYDNFVGFGGDGIHPIDIDGDGQPDYLDSDTDNDGVVDIIEGNDLNFNGSPDDGAALTGIDTDGDGLDNFFDNDNTSAKATSRYMGTGGTTSGDVPPGSITTVQHTMVVFGCATERDWRCLPYILACDIITINATPQVAQVQLDWTVLCKQEADQFIIERSTDGSSFTDIISIPGRSSVNEKESYRAFDDIRNVQANKIFYRLKTVLKSGKTSLSAVIVVNRNNAGGMDVRILPNPVKTQLQLVVNAKAASSADICIIDANGKIAKQYREKLVPGNNTFTYYETNNLPTGTYYLRIYMNDKVISQRFNIIR